MARYLVAGGDGNWSNTNNWSATDGGGSGASVPVSTDDVFLNANSAGAPITVNASSRAALSLTCTGYTGTITFDQTLTVTNNITLGASMTFAGTAALISINTCTFTSAGKTVGVPLTLSGVTCTMTLADAMVCGALLTLGANTSATKTINSSTITANAGLTLASAGSATVITGTTVITLGGGTLTGVTTCTLVNPLTFNATTFTVTGTLTYRGGPLTYVAGTATLTGATLSIGGAATTLAIAGMTWPTLTFTGSTFTFTLTQDINCVNLNFLQSTSATHTLAGAFNINCSGNLVHGGSTNGVTTSTTVKIVLTGAAAVWSASNTSNLRVDIDINTAGTLTLSGTVYYSTRTLRWVAGTLLGAATPLLRIAVDNTSLDFNGASVPWVIWPGGTTTILNQISDMVLANAGGILCTDGDEGNEHTWRANLGGTRVKLTIEPGAEIDVCFTDFTDIDCGDGDTLWVYKGTLTNTINISQFTPYTSPFSDGSAGAGGGGVPVLGSSWS